MLKSMALRLGNRPRLLIKFIPALSEADEQDPLNFGQYCLANTSAYLN
jgi:hypothetical protein